MFSYNDLSNGDSSALLHKVSQGIFFSRSSKVSDKLSKYNLTISTISTKSLHGVTYKSTPAASINIGVLNTRAFHIFKYSLEFVVRFTGTLFL